jgi:hypothetical protein
MGARDRLLARWLRKEGLTDRVTSAAGVDAEPARNPSFHPDARLLPPRGPALVLALREHRRPGSAASPRRRTSRRIEPVERLVDEAVGEVVVLAAHRGVRHAADLPRQFLGFPRERAQRLILDPVLTPHLFDEQL